GELLEGEVKRKPFILRNFSDYLFLK
ncbi:MAG: hypothetical protein RL045_409, partial [Bacteroidota bacterium]